MALQFSHSVGYRGVCKLKPKSGSLTPLLCTGGSISLTQQPIMGSGVWGAGYANAAPIAYAWNYLNLQGSANYQLTRKAVGGSITPPSVWKALKQSAFTARTEQTEITLLPDGQNGFTGNGWISSLSFEASEGAAITGSFNFKGDPSPNINGDNGSSGFHVMSSWTSSGMETGDLLSTHGVGGATSSSASPLAGQVLIPYWETCCGYVAKSGTTTTTAKMNDVISWSCSYNSDIQMLKCMNAQGSAPLSADYVLLGQMSGDGSYTVFRLYGDFQPKNYHTEKKFLTFAIGSKTQSRSKASLTINATTGEIGGVKGAIQIPLAIVNSASTSMTTGGNYITAEFSFTALGDGTGGVMKMLNTSTDDTI